MKKAKIISIFLIAILILGIGNVVKATDMNCKIDITTEKTALEKGETITIDIKLDQYTGDGILGYQGKLEFNKSVFEFIGITSDNNWDTPTYDKTTGIVVSSTGNARANTKIATITLKVKENVDINQANVVISNLQFTDGDVVKNFEKTISYNINSNANTTGSVTQYTAQSNVETLTRSAGESNTRSTADTSTGSSTGSTSQSSSSASTTTTETQSSGSQSTIPNLPSINDTTSNTGSTSNDTTGSNANSNNNDNQANQFKVEAVTDKTETDTTKAENNIPQTGEESTTIIIIGLVLVLGTFGFIRYKSIKLK